ncbi:MAG: isoleucine--tRNA ligase [Acidimicrobiia bacterium]|nr:isoleucine--tRNA ligase [Acidimicrobiia bacterium]
MTTRFPRPTEADTFAALEERRLERWSADDTFRRSVEARRGGPTFVFYDGPPFANGLPHYGHILTSYVKDSIPRYFTMRGNLVERRWGWDCHGLPVELDAQQKLGLRGVKEINEFGVGAFNEVCRDSVFTYAAEWRKVIDRIGRWVDWDDQYRTLDLSYMETVMHIFATMHHRGLVYESYKVLAYCTSCQTPLSNFETRLDDSYRDRTDPTVTVRLPLVDRPSTSLLVWTTTPWTLPSNVLAAVNPDLAYETWRSPDDGSEVVLAASSFPSYADELEGWTRVATSKGADWVGHGYEPVFDYFADVEGAFRVVAADFVTEGDGTGIVHMAPGFGEDDARVGHAEGVRGPMPVRDDGTFDPAVHDFAGVHVLDANAGIEQLLRDRGRVFAAAPHVHAYPHCWRCDSPLIYRAIDSWMVAIDKLRDQMTAANEDIRWIPDHVGPGAMGHGIASAPDWALTRNRFWGSPVPVWKCDTGGSDCAHVVPASIAELEELAGTEVTDLHRPAVDELTWACECGGTMRRVADVLDCWFESGSMPFAQVHWMGEPVSAIQYPADFIVEYVGQVRGWFYTLIVMATALTQRASFRNCLAHGILLGDDGRKLSKRLRNFPDPDAVIGTYGSDALRAALLSSPIVRGGDGSVSIDTVSDASRRFLAPLWNAYTFFATYAETAGYTGAGPDAPGDAEPAHPLDRFALAAVEHLRDEVTTHMDAFELAQAYEAVGRFLDRLTNWYIRLSRRRFYGPTGDVSGREREPFDTLYAVLSRTAVVVAPLLPFLADELHERLGGDDSVHLADWPAPAPAWADADLIAENDTIRNLVSTARALRAEARIPNRQPLSTLMVAGADPDVVARYRDVIESEANVKEVRVVLDAAELSTPRVVPDPRVLGPRLGAKVQAVLQAARDGDFVLGDDSTATVAGEVLGPGEFSVRLDPARDDLGVTSEGDQVVALDLALTPELEVEGHARVLLRHVQNLRKTAGLDVADRIRLLVEGGDRTAAVLDSHGDTVMAEVLAVSLDRSGPRLAHTADVDLDGEAVLVSLDRA